MMTILSWLGGRIAGPAVVLCALVFAACLAWQTARIDGWPLVGGGFKAQVAALMQQADAHALADAKTQAAALAARDRMMEAGETQARAHATADQAAENQTRIILQKVPVYVSEKSDGGCVVPWGAVRLLDAAASGSDPGAVRAAIAPGQPDDTASDVKLSEAVALLAADLGLARRNADQLTHLEASVQP
jgi:hypothetical protein